MDADQLEELIRDLGFTKIRVVHGQEDTNVMFCCPWHGENNPSCGVSASKEIGSCFTCHEKFGLAKLVAHMKEISIKRAKDFLEERFNVSQRTISESKRKILRYEECAYTPSETDGKESSPVMPSYLLAPYRSGKAYHSYLQERGISKDTAKRFLLGWDDRRCRITVPIFNRENGLLGFIVRAALDTDDPAYKKVYGNTDKYLVDGFKRSKALFPLHLFPENEDTAILVEGSFDAMHMHQLGFYNTLAVLTSSLSSAQISLLSRLGVKKIVLFFDNDQAGFNGMEKAYEALKHDFIVYSVMYPKGKKDPATLSKKEVLEMLKNKEHYNSFSIKKIE